MSVEPGRLLGDRYLLAGKVASGGMGDVWRADDTVLGRTVAVKILRPEHAVDPDFVERFRAEARHAAALSHPNIAAVHDYGETPENGTTLAFLVMELVPGEPLAALLERSSPLSVDRTLELMAQAAEGLQAAHDQGVIHRDVKPGNILVRPGRNGTASGGVALTDFGIARATNDPGHLTRSGLVLGTAYYLSPEQAQGHPVTPASDVYSLGIVMYECLAGQRPFTGDNAVHVAVAHMRNEPPPLSDSVPSGVRDLVGRMLAKDPADRPASAAEVAAAARALLATHVRDEAAQATVAAPTAVLPAAAAEPGATTAVVDPAAVAGAAAPPSGDTGKRPRWRSDAYADQKRTRGLLLLVGLIVVVVGAALLALLNSSNGGGKRVVDAARTPSPTPSPTARTVQVAESAYVNRSYADVRRALVALGLAVVRRDVRVDEDAAGSVLSVDPHGSVPINGTVTVAVGVPTKHGHGNGGGEGNQND